MFLYRCRFDVDLEDEIDAVIASIFGDLAEKLLTFTAAEAMDHFNQVSLLPLRYICHEAMHSFHLFHVILFAILFMQFFQNIEPQLDHVHESLKIKWFVAHLKPVQSQLADVKQQYTIIYCCETSEYQSKQQVITQESSMFPLTYTSIESPKAIVEGMLLFFIVMLFFPLILSFLPSLNFNIPFNMQALLHQRESFVFLANLMKARQMIQQPHN